MSCGHQKLLRHFLQRLIDNEIATILDAGSGRTSLQILLEFFDAGVIDAIIYPGDIRKIDSVRTAVLESNRYNIIECDICKEDINKPYDLVVAHLLLGEAVKFGNDFTVLLTGLMMISCRYLIIIDYLEDPQVCCDAIEAQAITNDYSVIEKAVVVNENPQVWPDFTGYHNFGFLLKKNGNYSASLLNGVKIREN